MQLISIDCPNCKKLKKSTFQSIQDTEHIDLSRGSVTRKLRDQMNHFDQYMHKGHVKNIQNWK